MMKAEDEQCLALEVQYACAGSDVPDEAAFRAWTLAALGEDQKRVELVIRIVDEAESRALNKRYRGKDKPTNVLSFPFEAPPGVDIDHMGDLVICAAVVDREAADQHKPLDHHWAHMVVHGILHLRGYDHENRTQAREMEDLERRILAELGFADPYALLG